ncbi:DNA polymerase III subunit epsilon [Halopseudomonas phragmitis]|uniref:DNA polymerase III subunit epsilon n=2 Tax=Pseudomonadaceae TaxID=135621 RepID=A0A1V0B6B8_9GAMM|nr:MULTISPECIES: DNA polymerase III subunit epsilon [Pseudomonadaceae]AQZ95492.1 DNA polymerase III subunit epsilon [Halopseudomonas phragmitis]RHW22502.1 DNA polymerase III subunit epsilon [Pseudomonas jilinensis]
MREVVLDTETTGIEPKEGHRIIEIGCVELIGRRLTGRHYHVYINPQREVDEGAIAVHGITNEFLVDKPLFADVVEDFMRFISGARLVIHNAAFDVGFIDSELDRLNAGHGRVIDHCSVLDTLAMAREKHPGQRNSLDALCKRYGVDNSQRDLHGALLDAEILADVYLIMTGGQTALSLAGNGQDSGEGGQHGSVIRRLSEQDRAGLRVLRASEAELAAHAKCLAAVEKSAGFTLWQGKPSE